MIIEREHDAFRRQFDALEGLSTDRELDQAWTALVSLVGGGADGTRRQRGPPAGRGKGRVLPAFRDSIDLDRREESGQQWRVVHHEHVGARGLTLEHTGPQVVLEQQHDV